jgi:hypothetical protein
VTVAGDPIRLRTALEDAFADQSLAMVRDRLFLKRTSHLDERAYERIVDLENAMEKAGGLELI